MNQNQKLLAALVAAPLLGALAFFLSGPGEQGGEVVAEPVEEEPDLRDLAMLRQPKPIDNEEAADFMEARWGHLGDAGMVSPHLDAIGDLYFVEPRIFVAVQNGKKHLMRAVAKPERLGNTVRAKDTTRVYTGEIDPAKAQVKLPNFVRRLPPIEDPADMPPGLENEHPNSPNYDGVGSGK
ncbi:MAG: hypothetical protein ACYTFV_02055 [Planctomycetota bacterium]|jgi:hypothetical protein